jgi:hypothetical protein
LIPTNSNAGIICRGVCLTERHRHIPTLRLHSRMDPRRVQPCTSIKGGVEIQSGV